MTSQTEIQNIANICSAWKHYLQADFTEKPRLKNCLYSPKDSIYQNHIFCITWPRYEMFLWSQYLFQNSFCLWMIKTESLQIYLVNKSPKLDICFLQYARKLNNIRYALCILSPNAKKLPDLETDHFQTESLPPWPHRLQEIWSRFSFYVIYLLLLANLSFQKDFKIFSNFYSSIQEMKILMKQRDITWNRKPGKVRKLNQT